MLKVALDLVVPPDSLHDVAAAVETALSCVGVSSGWAGLCDRLSCRAYGYVGSGHYSAATHWAAIVDDGQAHAGDRCPPPGSFVFFDTGRIYGHVSIVVKTSPTCDWSHAFVVERDLRLPDRARRRCLPDDCRATPSGVCASWDELPRMV